MSLKAQIKMILQLSVPAILAQLSSIIMQYIDAAMVGRMGAMASASIGLVTTSIWLSGGLCMAAATGFTVQVAHRIGAGDEKGARSIMRQGLLCVLLFNLVLTAIAVSISGQLPLWLGGDASLAKDASVYFLIYACSLPVLQLEFTAGGMLQCSGNMRLPSMLNILMCFLDVVFNFFLIFPTRVISILGVSFTVWGAGLRVAGAAAGTALSELVVAILMLSYLLFRSDSLRLRRGETLRLSKSDIIKAVKISIPVAVENAAMSGAQVVATGIVAPIGTVAIAANSFSVTAESLCYMPGYGLEMAATTLVGQAVGAKRRDMTKRLAWLCTALGAGIMAVMAVILYFIAPQVIGVLTPDDDIRLLAVTVLRMEMFAEPLYGASIVAAGVFRGAGDTLTPSILSFLSMWAVRLPLARFLAPRMGLRGVWFAMCLELCVRGLLFLGMMLAGRWLKKANME